MGSDQAIINFNPNATTNFDPAYDASKIVSVNTAIPSISMLSSDSLALSINQLPLSSQPIPLKITTGVTGFHTVNFSGINNLNISTILLEDLFTGIIIDLNNNPFVNLFISDTTTTTQFQLRFGSGSTVTSCLLYTSPSPRDRG